MAKDPDQVHKYTATGTAATMLSNRISWFFDLKGTSVTLDSACSSSIVALDLACQGLWNHTTSMVSKSSVTRNARLTTGLGFGCRLQLDVRSRSQHLLVKYDLFVSR
jgi:acyl transferase domain-containing protein